MFILQFATSRSCHPTRSCGFSTLRSAVIPNRFPTGQTYEINTDGRDIALSVGIICESQQQAGLSYTGISDKEELEEVIVSAGFVSVLAIWVGLRQGNALGRGILIDDAWERIGTLQRKMLVGCRTGSPEGIQGAVEDDVGGRETYYSGFMMAGL